jgi:hypothetical protein
MTSGYTPGSAQHPGPIDGYARLPARTLGHRELSSRHRGRRGGSRGPRGERARGHLELGVDLPAANAAVLLKGGFARAALRRAGAQPWARLARRRSPMDPSLPVYNGSPWLRAALSASASVVGLLVVVQAVAGSSPVAHPEVPANRSVSVSGRTPGKEPGADWVAVPSSRAECEEAPANRLVCVGDWSPGW